jgi:hypothetical protein
MTTLPSIRRWRQWRRVVGCLCAALLVLQAGCYTYLPMQTNVPATGKRIAVVLNDRGRAMIGDKLGSAMDKADGLLVAADDASVTIEVYRTTDMKGNQATWTGERVTFPRDGVSGFQERLLSKKKSYMLVGAVVVGITVSVMMVNLNIFGGFSHSDGGSGGSTGDSR